MIDVFQKFETMKYGTGSAGAIDQADRATGGMTTSSTNADLSELVNQPPSCPRGRPIARVGKG